MNNVCFILNHHQYHTIMTEMLWVISWSVAEYRDSCGLGRRRQPRSWYRMSHWYTPPPYSTHAPDLQPTHTYIHIERERQREANRQRGTDTNTHGYRHRNTNILRVPPPANLYNSTPPQLATMLHYYRLKSIIHINYQEAEAGTTNLAWRHTAGCCHLTTKPLPHLFRKFHIDPVIHSY